LSVNGVRGYVSRTFTWFDVVNGCRTEDRVVRMPPYLGDAQKVMSEFRVLFQNADDLGY
jgi:hypothetical protein